MRYFIIEHPTRGCISTLWEHGEPRFTRADLRTDDKVEKFYHPAQAQRALNTFPARIASQCSIRESEHWTVVE